MKTVIIKENSSITPLMGNAFDLSSISPKNCVGCWSCWLKTPGRCAFKDLDKFYHEYVNADKVILFSNVTNGFVSSNFKTLFDRMIALFLPHIEYTSGESMHVPRYEKYPDIEFYYDGEFGITDGRKIFEDYITRVFYQFHSKKIVVKPIEAFSESGVLQ